MGFAGLGLQSFGFFWVEQWFGGVVAGLVELWLGYIDGCDVWMVICGGCGFVI